MGEERDDDLLPRPGFPSIKKLHLLAVRSALHSQPSQQLSHQRAFFYCSEKTNGYPTRWDKTTTQQRRTKDTPIENGIIFPLPCVGPFARVKANEKTSWVYRVFFLKALNTPLPLDARFIFNPQSHVLVESTKADDARGRTTFNTTPWCVSTTTLQWLWMGSVYS